MSSDETLKHLEQFCTRHVLDIQDGEYRCRVPLFEAWLGDKGRMEIVTSDPDLEKYLSALRANEDQYVTADEVLRLVAKWPHYKGQVVGPESVRAWLGQFGSPSSQRLMFRLISAITFFDGARIRGLLREAHTRLGRELREGVGRDRYGRGRMARSDILLSHVDGIGKSGAHYARVYANENGVYVDNIVPRERLAVELNERPEVEAVVFVDDFIGTGDSAAQNFAALAESLGGIDTNRCRWFFVTLCGCVKGVEVVSDAADRAGVAVEVIVCDSDAVVEGCFRELTVYLDDGDRLAARELAYEKGAKLAPRDPLGYGDIESLVVFDSSIPNNCPPILWHSGEGWLPLFKRI